MYQDSYREDNVFCKYRNLNIQTCLQIGLGELKLIPIWLIENYPNLDLDILEIDEQKRDKNFNIIYADAYEFQPTKKYDLIIIDIWYAGGSKLRQQIEFLKNKYKPYLNVNGLMSFPMIDMHKIYSYVEL